MQDMKTADQMAGQETSEEETYASCRKSKRWTRRRLRDHEGDSCHVTDDQDISHCIDAVALYYVLPTVFHVAVKMMLVLHFQVLTFSVIGE